MNKAIDFVMWLALKHSETFIIYYKKYLKELKKNKGGKKWENKIGIIKKQ